jgi:hypothetical protein
MRRKPIAVPAIKYTETHRWCPITKGMTNRNNCKGHCVEKPQCDLEEKAVGA